MRAASWPRETELRCRCDFVGQPLNERVSHEMTDRDRILKARASPAAFIRCSDDIPRGREAFLSLGRARVTLLSGEICIVCARALRGILQKD